jgi:hypothetical protein
LPFNMTEASKRLHAAEGLRVARSLVVGKSTMLLR